MRHLVLLALALLAAIFAAPLPPRALPPFLRRLPRGEHDPPGPAGDEGARPPDWRDHWDSGGWDGDEQLDGYPAWETVNAEEDGDAPDWWDSAAGVRAQIEQLAYMIGVAERLGYKEVAEIWRNETLRLEAEVTQTVIGGTRTAEAAETGETGETA
jgi:hypothetical protein